jgi:nucleoside-diphosphate-sugar epimerase
MDGRIIPSLIYKFELAKENNTNIYINSHQDTLVNLIFIKDIILIIEKCIYNNENNIINGNIIVFNPINNINLKYLTELLKSIFQFKNKIIFNDNQIIKKDQENNPNIEKFLKLFPNFEFSDLKTSLQETLKDFLENKPNIKINSYKI